MAGKGNQSEKGANGDLLIKIKVKPDPYFTREGVDIKSNLYISATEAILGGTANVKTVNGKQHINIEPGSPDGAKHVLKK